MSTPRKLIDQLLDGRHITRLKAEDRFLARQEKRELACEPLIGELRREGKLIYYINLKNREGIPSGKIKESASYFELVDYLVRNHYV